MGHRKVETKAVQEVVTKADEMVELLVCSQADYLVGSTEMQKVELMAVLLVEWWE